MMIKFFKLNYILTFAFITVFCVIANAQGTDSIVHVDFDGTIEAIYGAVIILFGYVSQAVPGLNKIKPWLRVAIFAIVAGASIVSMGLTDALPALFAYVTSSQFYELILKKVFKAKTSEVIVIG